MHPIVTNRVATAWLAGFSKDSLQNLLVLLENIYFMQQRKSRHRGLLTPNGCTHPDKRNKECTIPQKKTPLSQKLEKQVSEQQFPSESLICCGDRDLDDVQDRCKRLELALRGVFAGNVFDLGAQGTADMFENGEVALTHPPPIQQLSLWVLHCYVTLWVHQAERC